MCIIDINWTFGTTFLHQTYIRFISAFNSGSKAVGKKILLPCRSDFIHKVYCVLSNEVEAINI